ncbi:Nif3-like dinuclear metal center hexameric protein [Candidatus Aerophobetes bacterium]|nr:Nif3-like dinuclear metal center hexameric protein [Candidatus Aerophobetes bacterium]
MERIKVKDVIKAMEEIAPPEFALQGDRIGLQVGDEEGKAEVILLSLDVTQKVVKEAKEKKANLIISHHPLIYHPLKKITFQEWPSGVLRELIKNDISLYVAHTNLDIAPGGVNDALLKTLKKFLRIKKEKPLHLSSEKNSQPLGWLIFLEKEETLIEIAEKVKKALSCTSMRISGGRKEKIARIALCAGSGRDLIYPARDKKAQLLITGELSYHSLLEADFLGLSVIEAGHYETEVVVLPLLKEKLEKKLREKNQESKILLSEIPTRPYLTESITQVDI